VNPPIPENLCIIPWTHLVHHTNGSYGACCKIDGKIEKGGKVVRNMREAWESDYLQDLRQKFLSNERPKECIRCWQEESCGKDSDRIKRLNFIRRSHGESYLSELVKSGSPSPKSLDLKFNNLCNLKCRICDHLYSSKWLAEEVKHGSLGSQDYKDLGKIKWQAGSEDWKQFLAWLPSIDHIEIYGGEPLLAPEHRQVLNACVESGQAARIYLHYNSNATISCLPFLDSWRKFKQVEIYFSVDDVEKRFEYQRHGSRWSVVEKNISQLFESRLTNTNFEFFVTVNVFNVYYLPELVEWAQRWDKKIHLVPLQYPRHLNIQVFPDKVKAAISRKLGKLKLDLIHQTTPVQALINFMNLRRFRPKSWQVFLQVVNEVDHRREEGFKNYFPELNELFGDLSTGSHNSEKTFHTQERWQEN